MEFSKKDISLIAKLRAKQESWVRRRWWCLIGGIFCIIVGVWLIFSIAERASTTNKWDGEIVWLAPVFWTLYFQGIVMCAFAVIKWHGDPLAEIVLKLLDNQLNDTKTKSKMRM